MFVNDLLKHYRQKQIHLMTFSAHMNIKCWQSVSNNFMDGQRPSTLRTNTMNQECPILASNTFPMGRETRGKFKIV
jgi:hypothetical protein